MHWIETLKNCLAEWSSHVNTVAEHVTVQHTRTFEVHSLAAISELTAF